METRRSKLNTNLLKILSIRNYEGNDVEQKALELYQCLSRVSKSDDKYIYIYLRITSPKSTHGNLAVKIPKNFKIILLSSLRHLKFINKDENFPLKTWLMLITKDLLSSIDYLDFKSLYLLKVLDQVVLKKVDLIPDIHEQLFNKLYEVCYVSPLANLRNYAVSIIQKMELRIGKVSRPFNPLKNIGLLTNFDETRMKFEQIKTESIHSNLQEYMEFIHRYFHFNVHNKSAGIVYKAVISRYNIGDFKTYIWPFWSKSFEKRADSREFRQSFLKYWIPFSVQEYKTELYLFLREQNVCPTLLVEILYELRRKRHVSIEDLSEGSYKEDIIRFLENYETNGTAFEIICTFPSFSEEITSGYYKIFEDYCLNTKVPNSCSEKLLSQFLTHIFVFEHVRIQKTTNKREILICDEFIRKLNDFAIANLVLEDNLELSLILFKILACMSRPSKDLKYRYELPKKYQYGPGENQYLLYLKRNRILDIFTRNDLATTKLLKIFNWNYKHDERVTWLLKNVFVDFEIKNLMQDVDRSTKQDLENFVKYQELRLYKALKEKKNLSLHMIEHQIILAFSIVKINNKCMEEIFDLLKKTSVLVIAIQMGIIDESFTIFSMLDFIVDILDGNKHEGLSIKTRKILEHLFCKLLEIFKLSLTTIMVYSGTILTKLVNLIEKSNMKKVVTESLNLVPLIVEQMINHDSNTRNTIEIFYTDLMNDIVFSKNLRELSESRMRKHPRLRSLLHAVCKGSGPKQREYVTEAVKKMIWKLRRHNLEHTMHTVLLECLEILMVEPNFYNYTAAYIDETIELSLKSFLSQNWTVKNATIQLTNTIITRIFGVQQTENIRLRSFQEFSILFPRLSDYFFDILSSRSLDDRAVIILQYLSASEVQTYDHLNTKTRKKMGEFILLLEKLLASKEDYVIKFVPLAIVNLCVKQDYSKHMEKVFNFIVENMHKKPTNVVVNHLILFKEFVRRINVNYSFLKPMEVFIEASIVEVVNNMNNFLKNKKLQYLDLYNIRHFVLEQKLCFEEEFNLDVSLKRWNSYNLIVNFPCGFMSKNFWKFFDFLYENSDLNFLLESFLERIICYAVEDKDLNLISRVFKVISIGMFCSRDDKKLRRIFTESILALKDFVEILNFEDIVIGNMKNMNFYEAVLVQIILTKKNCQNKADLCEESFKQLSNLSKIENFGLDLLPNIFNFVYKNLEFIDRYSFLKLLLYLVLYDCDDEVFYMFLTQFCKKCVNENNCAKSLLNREFLLEFLRDDETVRKILVDSIKILEKLEGEVHFDTFYTDTYTRLRKHGEFINKYLLISYEFFFLCLHKTFVSKKIIKM